jgi:16S rRNA pseudouridine516 synthase
MPRIDRLIARTLGASRKHVTQWLKSGQVTLPNGEVVEEGGFSIAESALPLTVTIGNDEVTLRESFSLLLNKPTGYVTALKDREHPIASQLIADAPLFDDLRAVGRLDKDTTGLLLWTTDGQLLHKLTHPKNEISRTYQAALARPVGALPAKLVLDDGHEPNVLSLISLAGADAHPSLVQPTETKALASITIVGGAYHEVRRIFAALGSHVLGLCRVGYGGVQLPPDLELGAWINMDDLVAHFPQLAPKSK